MRIETKETLRFIRPYLRRHGLRVLEIGCGSGRLAAVLQGMGHEIVAIDRSMSAVREARTLGVDARYADIRRFRAERFDLILFSRSLHHIHQLDAALRRAYSLLKPGGRLLVEDFAYEDMDSRTARWLYQVRGLRRNAPLAAWKKEHQHDPPLATGARLIGAVRKQFDAVRTRRTAYLFRYMIEDGKDGEAVFHQEKRLIASMRLRRIGLNIMALRLRKTKRPTDRRSGE